MRAEGNRPSQRPMPYIQDEDRGVTFHYRDLEVPERRSDFFTFDTPREVIRGGELVIHFDRAPDVAPGSRLEREVWRNPGGWGVIGSEAWLMKRFCLDRKELGPISKPPGTSAIFRGTDRFQPLKFSKIGAASSCSEVPEERSPP